MAIRSRLEISSWLILEGLRSNFNRAFSISLPSDSGPGLRELGTCSSGLERIRDAERKIAKNLRLGNFSSLILMGFTRNSNSRFAIRRRPFDSRWSLRMPMLDASAFAIRIAEMRWAADGGRRVELPLLSTTDVNALVTICQGRTGRTTSESPSCCKVYSRHNFATDRQRAGLLNFVASRGLVVRQSHRTWM
jgi:hypothetical protein